MKGYKHLTIEDRITLEALLKAGHSKPYIAKQLGCHWSTVYREIKKGLYDHNIEWNYEKRYSADIGQKVHDENATSKGRPLKVGNDWDFVNYVEDKIINCNWSPDAIIGRLKLEGRTFKGSQ